MHKQYMIVALQQAWLGRGLCAPNPSVGAVVVQNDKIISMAWHQGPGNAHAERAALQKLAPDLKELTLYVTLEPCNHWGRTPPCVSIILEYDVKRVVYAYRDPNPVVAGNDTPKLLAEQGIEVIYYPLPEIVDFYQSYLHWTLSHKPWVTAKIAQTLDGKIADVDGERLALSNDKCALITHEHRWRTDVILTSAKTVVNDNPLFNARINGKIQSKVIAIIDARLSINAESQLFTQARHCHIYYDNNVIIDKKLPKCSYHPVKSSNGRLDLSAIIDHLGSLGFHDVWVETGGELFSALHAQGLINKTYLYIVPKILGEKATNAYHNDIFEHPYKLSWEGQADNMVACIEWQEDRCLQD